MFLNDLRLLSPLAQQYVLKCLFLGEEGTSLETVRSWTHQQLRHAKDVHENALDLLQKLAIIEPSSEKLILADSFRRGLIRALTPSSMNPDDNTQIISSGMGFGVAAQDDGARPTPTDLEKYAADRWDSVLHFMVGSSQHASSSGTRLSASVLNLLESSGLMAKPSSDSPQPDGKLHITQAGFRFLLQDMNTQIWSFLLQYVEIADRLGMDMIEMLQFFFMLGCLELGMPYSSRELTPTQQALLGDLADFGLVWRRSKKSFVFYPTKFATTLTVDKEKVSQAHTREAFLVIETNYRIYAYTQSPLQISVLGLFVSLKARFPNMVVGMITRDSVRSALQHGITAAQIVHYLTVHAHTVMKQKTPVLPQTVSDQIALWELERNRLMFKDAFLYKDFEIEEEFDAAYQYAQDLKILLWSNPHHSKRWLVVTAEGHAILKDYVKSLIAARRSGYTIQNPGLTTQPQSV